MHPYKLLDTTDPSKVEETISAVLPLLNTGAERGNRNFNSDLVAIFEAVSDGFHWAVNANWYAADLNVYDALRQRLAGEADNL
jgi:hypothetical protein